MSDPAGLYQTLLGIGNPLLDISAEVPKEFYEKYDLKPANQILAEEKHLPMYKDLVDNFDAEYIAGGATQNSIRVAQWMLQVKGATSYIGCVGDDWFAKKMKEASQKDGVNVQYLVDKTTPTGTCGVCLLDKERSLVANLAAANNYKIEHLKDPVNWSLVDRARVIYSAGFFITVSPESRMLIAKHCCENNKIFCTNISAPFIVQVPPFKKALMEEMPYVDFIFGNELEAAAFAESESWDPTDLEAVALKISSFPKANGSRARVVVITQGAEDTLVAVNGKVKRYRTNKISSEEMVDTNGAGDAFVGGFLSQLICGKRFEECVRAGNFAATEIIKRSGCTMPDLPYGFSFF